MATYSKEQVDRYLRHIGLPESFHHQRADDSKPEETFELLRALQKYHLATVPFSSVGVHYSKTHRISLDSQDIFSKIVDRGHGGYCMENNYLFLLMLKAFSFDAHSVGSRVFLRVEGVPTTEFAGWSHVVLITTIATNRYMVDVGFGGDGPTQPLPLAADSVRSNIHPQEMRLVWEHFPESATYAPKIWTYQVRTSSAAEWKSTYLFTEVEFFQEDFEIMNFWVYQNPKSPFSSQVWVSVKILQADELVGSKNFDGVTYKERLGATSELIKSCHTEKDRIEVLEQYFRIVLNAEEREGIIGTVAALPEAQPEFKTTTS